MTLPPVCPYCNRRAKLEDSAIVYQRSYGPIWHCAPCAAFVGVHRNSPVYAPLGTLANAELRALRRRTHAAFDPIWQSGTMRRGEAYGWLADRMGLAVAHVGEFDLEQCRREGGAPCRGRRRPPAPDGEGGERLSETPDAGAGQGCLMSSARPVSSAL